MPTSSPDTVRAVHVPARDRWVLVWDEGRSESPPMRLRSIPGFLDTTFGSHTPTIQWPAGISELLDRVDVADQEAARAQAHAQMMRREVAQGLLDTGIAGSFGDVAAILGVTRQRIHHLLTPDH